MPNSHRVHVGVDVGGTNTDAVVLSDGDIIGWSKQVTTDDVTSGVAGAIVSALDCASSYFDHGIEGVRFQPGVKVNRVHIGTTHFINAVLQKQHLVPVAVIRLCGPATQDLPPLSDFNSDLKSIIGGPVFMISGGYMFDGEKEISAVNKAEVEDCVQKIRDHGVSNIVVSGVFSPVNNTHEIQVGNWVKEFYPRASVTLSHEVAQLGILLRENSAVLNESLKPLSCRTMSALRNALNQLKLNCPFYLTQNDGTLINSEQAQEFPVLTFASGATNSMRGAAYLSGVKDAVILDIGGTSTDAGILKGGFPRQASSKVEIGGILTSFHMPDTVSIALGGGSKVRFSEENKSQVFIGPESVGNRIRSEAVVFGGHTLTTTDVAVAEGLSDLATFEKKAHWLPESLAKYAIEKVHSMISDLVDRIKTSKENVPVIIVGGASILVDTGGAIPGTTEVIRPPHYQVANAVGAALSQVSGLIDTVEHLTSMSREEAIENVKQLAKDLAIRKGADPKTTEIVEVNEVPLTYLPGNVTRLQVKAVGDIFHKDHPGGVSWKGGVMCGSTVKTPHTTRGSRPASTSAGETVAEVSVEKVSIHGAACDDHQQATENVNPESGEWVLTEQDVEYMAVGAGILGCGGGGNPLLGKLSALQQIRAGKKIRVISAKKFRELSGENDYAVPMATMGAPTVKTELLLDEVRFNSSLEAMKELYSLPSFDPNNPMECSDFGENNDVQQEEGVHVISDFKADPKQEKKCDKNFSAIFTFEIGGSNSMEDFLMAVKYDIPVIDCDGMGRAFPELQMLVPWIYGVPFYPATLGDFHGKKHVLLYGQSAKKVENNFRKVCVEMGCLSSFCGRPLTPAEVQEKTVLYSLSRAWKLGEAVHSARARKTSPVEAILQFEQGKLICTSKICDVERKTVGGFARGEMKLEGLADFHSQMFQVSFQNENLIAEKLLPDGKTQVLATVPDLISVVDLETGEPFPTDELRYGLRVAVLCLPAPPQLRTSEALAVVGPRAFGYNMDYQPVGEYSQHGSIPPE